MAKRASFGVALQNFVPSGGILEAHRLIANAELIESLGYDSVWVWDHILLGSKNPFPILDSLSMLASIASRTSKVRLGTGILVLPLRNPVVLAKVVATIDHLSGGRLILGVASGWYQREFQACGVDFNSRGRIAERNLKLIRRLWSEDKVSDELGPHLLKNVAMEPKPLQKPIPIWMGGYVDSVLRRVAKYSDGWLCFFYRPDALSDSWEKVKAYAREARRADKELVCSNMVPLLISHKGEKESRPIAEGFAKSWFDLPPWSKCSADSSIVGTSEECIRQVEAFIDAGVKHLILVPVYADMENVKAFAREVIPSFS